MPSVATLQRAVRAPWRSLPLVLGGLLTLAACEEQSQAPTAPPRPIKTYTVSEAVGGMERRFSGIAEAAETTALSFPVGGTVTSVRVQVGATVAKDEVIAELDREPFELDLRAAKAEVDKANSDLVAKEAELNRNRVLFEKGWIAAAAIDKHVAAYEAAKSTLDYARSRRAVAQRNLDNATLRAPYAGTVATQPVERFEDVQPGQAIVELNSTDGLVVAFAVPETGIKRIALGQPVNVTFASQSGRHDARITEIDAVAASGNAYTVKASLLDASEGLRPGMTAQITIAAIEDGTESGFLVPLSAIAPGEADHVGAVYRYDADAGVVRRTPIRARGVRENLIIVYEGVGPGDVIAAAGVSFLTDGLAVRLTERP